MRGSIAAVLAPACRCQSRRRSAADHDLEGQPHHVGLDVARFAVFPGHQHPLSVLNHHICISGDAVAMERRFSQPRRSPENALGGQETLAQGSPCIASR